MHQQYLQLDKFHVFPFSQYYFSFAIHQVIDRTRISYVESLERHLMWDDIAILARYLLMLSFNDSLDGK